MNVEALRALEKAVEAGDSFGIIPKGQKALGNGDGVCAAFDGSTDAALSLLASVLPGWFIVVTRLCDEFDAETVTLIPSDWRAEVSDGYRGGLDDDDPESHFSSADNKDPARAILLAIISALISQAEKGEG